MLSKYEDSTSANDLIQYASCEGGNADNYISMNKFDEGSSKNNIGKTIVDS